jgi:hypothetical protein
MRTENTNKIEYTTPSVKEYGSVSDLVGTNFGGGGAADGGGAGYTS